MTGRLLPDKLTPVTCADLFNGFLRVWEEMGVNPTRATVTLKVVHCNAEVGERFSACHCYNLGNIKALVLGVHGWTGDFTMFECGEEVTEAQYQRLLFQYKEFANCLTVKSRYVRATKSGPINMVSLRIKPPHPWSRFRAFDDLFDGVRSQLSYLESHQSVLNALMTGNLETYNRALHDAGYYTADASVYLKLMKSRVAIVEQAAAQFDWGDVA
jgi:hypothetical protein